MWYQVGLHKGTSAYNLPSSLPSDPSELKYFHIT